MDAETKDLCTALRDPEALYQNGAALADEAAELIETLCARLESPPKSGGSVCEWTPYYEEDDPATAGYMQSGCHDEHGRAHEWMDGEGDPPGRWMKFCPFCGGKTAFVAQESEPPKPDSYDRFADEMQDEFERRMAEPPSERG